MKKSLMLLFLGFVIFGIMLNSIYVLADDNSQLNSGAGNVLGAGGASADSNGSDLNAEDQGGAMVQNRVQQHTESEYEFNGTHVHISREVQTEDGATVVQIQRTITYANGTQLQINLQIQTRNQNGTLTRSINMEREGEDFNVSVEDGLNVTDVSAGNQSQIIAGLSNGNMTNITILPDQAAQIALERLRIRNQVANNGTNVSIQLQEKVHNNIPQVVYNIEADKPGKFLGVFKLNMKVSTEVDPETGNVVSVNQPWWAFMVSSDSGSGQPSAGNETNSTNSS
ncbi:MAG: hypothetical protein M1165_01935 [Candidatus Pacearchaeota archaeon]|nr:hypothetical protein [Candidatus Pacearchaeota archaeon]